MRVNLHLRLDGAGRAYAYGLNCRVRAVAPSSIMLSPGSAAIPHITLLMGSVRCPPEELAAAGGRLTAESRRLVNKTGIRSVQLRPPRVSAATRGYVLSDIVDGPSMVGIHQHLCEMFVPALLAEPSPLTEPHVTIARVDEISVQVIELLAGITNEVTTGISSVALSCVGPNGTCVGTISEQPL
jgi:hypothetical protein